MAIAVEVTFQGPGATLENYLKSIEIMGARPEGTHPDPDCLFHWVADTDDGFRVIDVWKSRGQFDEFVQSQVAPVGAQLGMPEPQIRFMDVANYLTAGG